jgi:putative ABC transport system ATP-binding protein
VTDRAPKSATAAAGAADDGATAARAPLLRADRLGRAVAGRPLVEDVSFEVAEGEVLGIVGPSGSGKSSLLRLLNRLDEPTAGTVWLGDTDYRSLSPRALRRRVGMVMQAPALFPGTVAENVRFGPAQAGVTHEDAVVEGLLAQVGLAGYGPRAVDHLSGGESQRVAIARALANEPALLLLDEPTSALDEGAKAAFEALLAAVARARSLTCVIVTHDLAQAQRLATRALVLEGGRVRRIGPVEEVLRAEGDVR